MTKDPSVVARKIRVSAFDGLVQTRSTLDSDDRTYSHIHYQIEFGSYNFVKYDSIAPQDRLT